ncbi:hypothetical protein T484DRAFT_1860565 [Baffinella frigidus]|nr:hypothetical protein T484DRAFT_1860565 [Cryptophyta sp. CCMP2293]
MGLEGPEMLKQRVAFLEDLLEKERSRHESHLREISSAAGCREARAMSLCASWRGATLDSSGSEQANIGPGAGVSPNDAESRRPPQGAQDPPPASKLDRWVKRAKTPGESPPEGTSPSTAPKSKLDRWLAKSKTGQDPSPPTEGVTKLDRWLTKSKKPEGAESPSAQVASAALEGQWAGEASAFSFEQQDELMVRIREALTAMDAAFELVERAKAEDPSPVGDRKKECPLCSKSGDERGLLNVEASEVMARPYLSVNGDM